MGLDIFTLFTIALGLSMDAFAVSISNSMSFSNLTLKMGMATSLVFGAFQGLMPTIGYFAGIRFSDYIRSFDHWVAFSVLGFIGGKMIWEAVQEIRSPHEKQELRRLEIKMILLQALATSIDALAVGVSFSLMEVNIFAASGSIAAITFLCCGIAVLIGRKFGALLKEKAEIFGGVILTLIGLKILIEHLASV